MAILRVKDDEGNIYDITAIKGDKGDPYTLTEEDKAELVADVLEALPTWEGGSF